MSQDYNNFLLFTLGEITKLLHPFDVNYCNVMNSIDFFMVSEKYIKNNIKWFTRSRS